MFEIFICVFIFYMGMLFGEIKLSWHLRDIIRKEAIKEGLRVDSEYNIIDDNRPIVEQLYIEKTNNILYLYNREDKSFVCQAKSLDELAILAMKYNNVKYAAVMIGEEIYAFVDGKVKTEKEIIK